ncbi:MAG: DUF4347 domain-containing protein [Cyanobacteria bacterium P01_E01_bin.6]
MASVSTFTATNRGFIPSRSSRQLVVIDSRVSEFSSIIADVQASSSVLLLDKDRDGILQITEFLKSVPSVSSLHLVSHGASGNLHLGNAQLNLSTLDFYLDRLKSWGDSLQGADLFLYGCQVAAGGMGELFIERLHRLTGANISASSKLVGNTPEGSNWLLDVRIGDATSEVIFSEHLQQHYSGHFLDISISQNTDTLIETSGTSYTLTFTFQEAPDQTVGTSFLLSTDAPNALGEFSVVAGSVTGLNGAPIIVNARNIIVNVDGQVGGELPANGPFTASITVPIVDDETLEGPEEITWTISSVPANLVDRAPGVTEGVTVDQSADEVTVTIYDNISQLPTLNGTSGADTLAGSAQTEAIRGLGGNDVISGAGGGDALFGNGGSDTISGQSGDDTIVGGAGNDRLIGNSGNDEMFGGGGNDRLIGGGSRNRLFGNAGNDFLFGGASNDVANGGTGNDLINGGAGNDRLIGGVGRDTLVGAAGNDVLLGGDGADTLRGGAGNDLLVGGQGVDVLFGQQGRDRFRFNNSLEGRDTIRDFNASQDRIEVVLTGFRNGLRRGTIAANQFALGSATQSTQRFIFRNDILFFDPDGSGAQQAVQLAKVIGNDVTRSNIIVV